MFVDLNATNWHLMSNGIRNAEFVSTIFSQICGAPFVHYNRPISTVEMLLVQSPYIRSQQANVLKLSNMWQPNWKWKISFFALENQRFALLQCTPVGRMDERENTLKWMEIWFVCVCVLRMCGDEKTGTTLQQTSWKPDVSCGSWININVQHCTRYIQNRQFRARDNQSFSNNLEKRALSSHISEDYFVHFSNMSNEHCRHGILKSKQHTVQVYFHDNYDL